VAPQGRPRRRTVVNVDNSCAGGSSALHLGVMAALTSNRPILVLGVEKMWTGTVRRPWPASKTACLLTTAPTCTTGSSLTKPERQRPHDLNARWRPLHARAWRDHRTGGRRGGQGAAQRRSEPLAQIQQAISLEEVLRSPQVAGVLTRAMCSSFCDGAAAAVLAGPDAAAVDGAPRIIGSVPDPATAQSTTTSVSRRRPRPPGTNSASDPATSTWSSSTTPPAPRSSMRSSLSASSLTVRPTCDLRGDTAIGGSGSPSTRAAALLARPPARRTALRSSSSWPTSSAAAAAPDRCEALGLASRSIPVDHRGDAAFVGIHAVAGG